MKKLLTSFLAVTMGLLITSCQQVDKSIKFNNLTKKEIANGKLTPKVLLKLRRISGSTVSPDGKLVAYSVSCQNVKNNSTYSNLFYANIDDTLNTNITSTNSGKNFSPQWNADGDAVFFLSSTKKGNQVFRISLNGEHKTQITKFEGGVNSFSVSPKGDKIWYTKSVKVEANKTDLYPSMEKSTARIYDDLLIRHWDYWLDGSYQHVFVADLTPKGLFDITDINEGEAWDTPMAPYFDASSITWNNSGSQIAYTSKKIKGKEYATSTNSDIFVFDIANKQTSNISEGMLGYDQYPTFSGDDSHIAWWSMERAGNEADKRRLFVANLKTNEKTYLTKDFDYNAEQLNWVGEDIYFIAPIEATHQVCKVSSKGNSAVEIISNGLHDLNLKGVTKDNIVVEKSTIDHPTEIYTLNRENKAETKISSINDDIFAHIKMGEVQKRWVKTSDGKNMLVWVTLPPNFDASKKYPTLLFCEGGPQSVVSNGWSYRWNFELMASNGYIVVAPNRRGLPSFGQEWLDQISGDYSGQNIQDYLSAIDDVAKEPWSDETRLGAVGASYGGYSVYYLASHHNKRFKTFISHCGMFNFESFYGGTEELWFPNNDLGGAYWEEGKTIKRSYDNSPNRFISKWDTPIMIVTGMNDYRIPYTQSLEAYTAARMKGVDARLLVFEDEAHQVFKPQNALVWHGEFFRWLDKYLK
ncbi:MAG: S9 family peptidase [Bacteroidetes bacterium]|nr:S9 family peptidase [Bacteroidota bacterium]